MGHSKTSIAQAVSVISRQFTKARSPRYPLRLPEDKIASNFLTSHQIFHTFTTRQFSASQPTLLPSKMSSGLKIISTSGAAAPRAPYSQAIAVNGFIYCSGQVPITPEGVVIIDDIKAGALQSLTNLKSVLEAAGSTIEKIFKVNIYLVDMADFAAVNEVYSQFFGTHRPARTCIAIHQLPLGAHVEIECIALE
ncbi:Endoribonuclease L-PSP/chorismate mutase-like protein [Lipomyces arxii]|uniref:Endoribonuclease L-PSP/chorismate mutase-like protein n=1 Tax=Lipomyces arxii TaxID=56418 RepID=UPI0034CFD9E5